MNLFVPNSPKYKLIVIILDIVRVRLYKVNKELKQSDPHQAPLFCP